MATRKFCRRLAVGGLLVAAYVGGNLYHPTVVCGQSMSPTLSDGRVIWVDRFYYRNHLPQPGDVVVFRLDGETYVKRVYRGPRQALHYLSSKGTFLMPLRPAHVEEVRRRYTRARNCLRVHTVQVPDDAVFVLGDNYMNSVDSRHLGMIPLSAIIGRAHVEADLKKLAQNEFVPNESPFFHARVRNTPPAGREAAENPTPQRAPEVPKRLVLAAKDGVFP